MKDHVNQIKTMTNELRSADNKKILTKIDLNKLECVWE
jgi:hypothetical protein